MGTDATMRPIGDPAIVELDIEVRPHEHETPSDAFRQKIVEIREGHRYSDFPTSEMRSTSRDE